MRSSEYSSEREMVVISNSLFPGDDIDFSLLSQISYKSKLNEFAEKSGWKSPDDAVVWMASDVTVLIPPPYPVSASEQEPEESPIISPLSPSAVMNLFAASTSLEPRPAKPLGSGAFEASDGYEIVMDRSGFMYRYACALNSVSDSMCSSCQTLAIPNDQCVECVSKGLTADPVCTCEDNLPWREVSEHEMFWLFSVQTNKTLTNETAFLAVAMH